MTTCFLCGGEIHGRSVPLWVQRTAAPVAPVALLALSDQPIGWHAAHPDCAAMLDDDDDDDDDGPEDEEAEGHVWMEDAATGDDAGVDDVDEGR